jgi:hypothetical protein
MRFMMVNLTRIVIRHPSSVIRHPSSVIRHVSSFVRRPCIPRIHDEILDMTDDGDFAHKAAFSGRCRPVMCKPDDG